MMGKIPPQFKFSSPRKRANTHGRDAKVEAVAESKRVKIAADEFARVEKHRSRALDRRVQRADKAKARLEHLDDAAKARKAAGDGGEKCLKIKPNEALFIG